MITESMAVAGMPLWADVHAADPVSSGDFYAGLFGWTCETHPDPDGGKYVLASVDGVPVAGLRPLADSPVPERGWTIYLATEDAAAIAERLGRWGARRLDGPTQVPWSGSTRLLAADPVGARIGFWQPGDGFQVRLHENSSLWWGELTSNDTVQSFEFYSTLFPFQREQFKNWYSVWRIDGTPYLGCLPQAVQTGPGWMPYFVRPAERTVDETAARAGELGGSVLKEPFDHSHGRVAVLADREGAAFTVIEIRRPAQSGS